MFVFVRVFFFVGQTSAETEWASCDAFDRQGITEHVASSRAVRGESSIISKLGDFGDEAMAMSQLKERSKKRERQRQKCAERKIPSQRMRRGCVATRRTLLTLIGVSSN